MIPSLPSLYDTSLTPLHDTITNVTTITIVYRMNLLTVHDSTLSVDLYSYYSRHGWFRAFTNKVLIKPNGSSINKQTLYNSLIHYVLNLEHIQLLEEIGDFDLRKRCVKFTDSRSVSSKFTPNLSY